MKVLKQLTLASKDSRFQLIADYHHVDDDSFEDRTGYSTDIIYEAHSYDKVANMGAIMGRAVNVTFTNLFEGNEMEPYRWKTDEPHFNNSEIMNEWINYHCPYGIDLVDGSYAEVTCEEGNVYACYASGDGDFHNHIITFECI